ncbi:hypothetical protein C5615_38950 [Burkholderia cepacia]|uniref:Uncharacterized protein n=3 Tax=Burkholderia cepacia complex TaxID=87882 RepID=A0A2S8HPQ3_BURCE|nr:MULTISPECIES: hypothetical protein [Burkholderia]AOI68720.1 hypothetical protein WI31_03560 [Burkholderia ubonensis]AWV01904.1 hypothetical protein DM992_20620 [Burkholderia sp. JP2-270]AWV04961.1 hypothetical protein DM992_37365 [Burkholderia sp. JP2-270]KFL49420.1 hypothetical protein JM78_34640 [Burkholderia pyrrocinia]KUZ15896.1 hypothetical protein WI29_18915 [Burkholderia ubonensis]
MPVEPRFIANRVVAIVVPKAPFVTWINSVDSAPGMALTLEQASENANAFLVPASGSDPDAAAKRWLQKHWQVIFERMLEDWYVDERLWPQGRTLKLFKEWCEIRMHSIVLDCAEAPISYED